MIRIKIFKFLIISIFSISFLVSKDKSENDLFVAEKTSYNDIIIKKIGGDIRFQMYDNNNFIPVYEGDIIPLDAKMKYKKGSLIVFEFRNNTFSFKFSKRDLDLPFKYIVQHFYKRGYSTIPAIEVPVLFLLKDGSLNFTLSFVFLIIFIIALAIQIYILWQIKNREIITIIIYATIILLISLTGSAYITYYTISNLFRDRLILHALFGFFQFGGAALALIIFKDKILYQNQIEDEVEQMSAAAESTSEDSSQSVAKAPSSETNSSAEKSAATTSASDSDAGSGESEPFSNLLTEVESYVQKKPEEQKLSQVENAAAEAEANAAAEAEANAAAEAEAEVNAVAETKAETPVQKKTTTSSQSGASSKNAVKKQSSQKKAAAPKVADKKTKENIKTTAKAPAKKTAVKTKSPAKISSSNTGTAKKAPASKNEKSKTAVRKPEPTKKLTSKSSVGKKASTGNKSVAKQSTEKGAKKK